MNYRGHNVRGIQTLAPAQALGFVAFLEKKLSQLLTLLHVPEAIVMPSLVKSLAGGTAFLGVISEMIRDGKMDAHLLNASAGWFLQTFDLTGIGIGILQGTGRRVARTAVYAMIGGIAAICLRTVIHVLIFWSPRRLNPAGHDARHPLLSGVGARCAIFTVDLIPVYFRNHDSGQSSKNDAEQPFTAPT